MGDFVEYIVMPILTGMGVIFLILIFMFGVHEYRESVKREYEGIARQQAIAVLQYQQEHNILPSE